jgi:hypothetical protein
MGLKTPVARRLKKRKKKVGEGGGGQGGGVDMLVRSQKLFLKRSQEAR